MQASLTLATLGNLDNGFARGNIDQALYEMIRDTVLRGADGKPRKCTITVTAKMMDGGQVVIETEAGNRLPAYRTNGTISMVDVTEKGRHQLLFQTESADNPNQKTIDEAMRDE